MTEWQFTGDFTWWQGLLLALFAAWLTWRVYRRETGFSVSRKLVFSLASLRALAVFVIVMLLTAPVLVHRKEVGELGKVYMFVDASQSMSLTDAHMSEGRKLLIAKDKGWVSKEAFDTSWHDAANSLSSAIQVANQLKRGVQSDQRIFKAADDFSKYIGEASTAITKLPVVKIADEGPARGSITLERWLNVQGNNQSLNDLSSKQEPFGRKADKIELLSVFNAPQNIGENLTTRIRGYLYPPVNGEYHFWINSDDDSKLLLSDSDDPQRKRVIAIVESHQPYNQWQDDRSRSKGIELVAGKRYYIEAVHVEGNGDDHVQVGWQLPDGSLERPIPGKHLSPLQTENEPRDIRQQLAKRFMTELKQPVDKLDRNDVKKIQEQLAQATIIASALEADCRQGFDSYAHQLLLVGNDSLKDAVAKIDKLSRWDRVSSMLLDNEDSLIHALADTHKVQLIAMKDNQLVPLWRGEDSTQPIEDLVIKPEGFGTNLADTIKSQFQVAEKHAKRVAAVVISDGKHNLGSSPLQVARILGNQQVPVITVGMGSEKPAPDMAVLGVDVPETVFAEDRIRGTIMLNDRLPSGQAFTLRVKNEGETVWEQNLMTTQSGRREVGFDFAIKDLVEKQTKSLDEDVQVMSLPLNLKVEVDSIAGEFKDDNNSAPLSFRAITQGRRVLVLDGRPRWEFRYLKNLFERDNQWDTNFLVGNAGTGSGQLADRWKRGAGEQEFPADKTELFKYDLIVFGEVKPGTLTEEELKWIAEFVEFRGGGIMFIDGQRGHFAEYGDSPIAGLLPVKRDKSLAPLRNTQLVLTDRGNRLSMMQLTPTASENKAFWPKLPAPHSLPRVTANPGTEVLVEAVSGVAKVSTNADDGVKSPVLVYQRYGAGKVLYSAMDESWRWRFKVADLYHTRYWNQISTWIMERPYAVHDKYVSLDVGNTIYTQGERANLRVRLRDENGKPITQATVHVELFRDGEKVGTAMLKADDNQGGTFRGKTDELTEPGEYEITTKVTGFVQRDMKAKTTFVVKALPNQELNDHQADFALLNQMSVASNGKFFAEEESDALLKELAPLSQGRIEISQTEFLKSYWVFIPIMLLFGGEWYLRKRAGLL